MLLTLLLCFFMAWALLRRFSPGRTAGGQILRDRAA